MHKIIPWRKNLVKWQRVFLFSSFLLFIVTLAPLSNLRSDKVGLFGEVNDALEKEMKGQPLTSESVEWTTNGVVICSVTTDQKYPQIVSDRSGGAIVTWQDNRSGKWDIYAQRVDPAGNVLWMTGGVVICNAINNQESPQIVCDGSGGAIVTWQDNRSGTNRDIYAQRVDSDGQLLWAPNGVVICNDTNLQLSPTLISDGANGAIIAWLDWRNSNWDIYAQLVDSLGITQWPGNGSVICMVTGTQSNPQLASNESGGTFIVWEDFRSGSNYDIYAQCIDPAGTPEWIPDGILICNASYGQKAPQLVSDGVGGVIIVWQDERTGGSYDNIYAQRVSSAGDTQWTENGTLVCDAANFQTAPQLISDGLDGVIITWEDDRSGSDKNIYAQQVNSTGNAQWTPNGTAISTAANAQYTPQLVEDGSGGAIIMWRDEVSEGVNDIYAQRIDATGNVRWVDNGIALCTALNNQDAPQLVSDGGGGAIIVWQDNRTGSEWDIYAQRIANAPPAVNQPNDIVDNPAGSETIDWIITDDQGCGEYRVIANDTAGEEYVWVDWTTWENNTALNIPINHTNEGRFNYTIEYNDDQGMRGTSDTVIVTLTTALPSGLSVTINGGATDTATLDVTLILAAIDATEMCFSNNGTTFTSWEPYSTSKEWTLEGGPGLKIVYFSAQNVNGPTTISTSITYTLPPSGLSISINNGAENTTTLAVTLTLSSTSATEMCFSNNGTKYTAWEAYNATKDWMLEGEAGSKTVYFKARNSTIEATPVSDTIIYAPPSGGDNGTGSGEFPTLYVILGIIAVVGVIVVVVVIHRMKQRKIPGQSSTVSGTEK
ncbi:MAG: 5'-nucleotidase [Promethearchaeota archaeon CR_4]|nr:MAG: 5'-nucleotidase [Candidatus Lokiarchaeota archaeon CR_4]